MFNSFNEMMEEIFKKDKQIADLEAKLAERTEQLKIALKDFNDIQKENDKLAQQLAEKDELLKQKIGDMKSTDFIRMCVDCGFMVQAKENDNQTAIAELIKVQKYISDNAVYLEEESFGREINDYIDQQIKSLKGEK